jgi:hypothetical protein
MLLVVSRKLRSKDSARHDVPLPLHATRDSFCTCRGEHASAALDIGHQLSPPFGTSKPDGVGHNDWDHWNPIVPIELSTRSVYSGGGTCSGRRRGGTRRPGRAPEGARPPRRTATRTSRPARPTPTRPAQEVPAQAPNPAAVTPGQGLRSSDSSPGPKWPSAHWTGRMDEGRGERTGASVCDPIPYPVQCYPGAAASSCPLATPSP